MVYLLGTFLVLVLFALAFAMLGARRVMYPPRPRLRQAPEGGQRVAFRAPDGVILRGWFFPAPASKGVIIYGAGHGEGLNAFDFRYIPLFTRNGYSLLIFDPRGLGDSGGVSTLGAKEWQDFLGAVDFLRKRNGMSPGNMDDVAQLPIGFFGCSQGAAAAILAAARCPEALAVAVESPFASWETTLFYGVRGETGMPDFLAKAGAWLIARVLEMQLGFQAPEADPVRVVGKIAPRPLLIIHGPHDPYIPLTEVERLFAAAGEPKELWVIPEAGHTQGLALRPAEYEAKVIGFFDRWLASNCRSR